jgi:hypothetical protein
MKVINTYWGFFCIQYKDRKPCSNKMRTKKYHTVVNIKSSSCAVISLQAKFRDERSALNCSIIIFFDTIIPKQKSRNESWNVFWVVGY